MSPYDRHAGQGCYDQIPSGGIYGGGMVNFIPDVEPGNERRVTAALLATVLRTELSLL
jgi:hypothetical protein